MLHIPMRSHEGFLLILLILVQVGTRETIETGQTSLFIALCMFGSMYLSYYRRTATETIASGLLLGLAISKILLTFPLCLLFLYRRRYWEILIAACVQVLGVWGIASLGTGLPGIIDEYWQIFMIHAGSGERNGMSLPAGLLKELSPYSYILVAIGSIALVLVLIKWHQKAGIQKNGVRTDFILLTVLMIWNLLVFYHRRYDYVAASTFIILLVSLFSPVYCGAELGVREKMVVRSLGLFVLGTWTLPFYWVLKESVYRSLFNIATITALLISTWLLFQQKSAGAHGDGRTVNQSEQSPAAA
jgi:hypothetical protein